MKITNEQIREIARINGIEYAALKAFIEVESSGYGFDPKNGKIIIQFEPGYYRSRAPEVYKDYLRLLGKSTLIASESLLLNQYKIIFTNKVDGQAKEWEAFNLAFKFNPTAAMRSTSIGLGQVMGDNFSALGYKTVNEMWDDGRRGEYQQVLQMVRFISSKPALYRALSAKNWHLVAYNYNGSGYKEMAKRLERESYDVSLQKAYNKYK